MKWLGRRGLLRNAHDADASNAPPELSPAEALATTGMQRGTLLTVRERDDGSLSDDHALAPPPRETDAVTYERFYLHASVHLAADDDLARERLCRYLTRPAFSLARFRVRRDGNISYRVKKVSRRRVTERVMTPVEALARLAAIVPPPRYPLLRFHGVLAPHHRWRTRVVPRPPARTRACKATAAGHHPEAAVAGCSPPPAVPTSTLARAPDAGDGSAAFALTAASAELATLTATGAAKLVAPNVLSITHWERLLEGELYASTSRLDWRSLLKRTFEVDLRVCLRCGGKLTVRAVLTDPATVATTLAGLARPRAPPTPAA
jgi:hypothetical protein